MFLICACTAIQWGWNSKFWSLIFYSKPVSSDHSKRIPKIGFQDQLSLNAGFLFVWIDSLHPINNLSVIKGRVSLGWTSTKLGLMFLLKDTTQWHRWGSNPQPLGLESSTLPPSHCDPAYCRSKVLLQESFLQYFRPLLSYHLSLWPLLLSIFEWPLKTDFTVLPNCVWSMLEGSNKKKVENVVGSDQLALKPTVLDLQFFNPLLHNNAFWHIWNIIYLEILWKKEDLLHFP